MNSLAIRRARGRHWLDVARFGESVTLRGFDGYLHDLDTGKGEKTLTFHPELPKAGKYEVRLAYVPAANRSGPWP